MDKQSVLAKISDAIEIVREVEDDWRVPSFQVVLAHLLADEADSTAISTATGASRSAPARDTELGLGEFLALLDPTNHPDTVETILYHALRQGSDSLSAGEILDGYRQTRRKPPQNLSDVLKYCIRRGHVVVAPAKKEGKKAWQITPSGERYVEELQTQESE